MAMAKIALMLQIRHFYSQYATDEVDWEVKVQIQRLQTREAKGCVTNKINLGDML